jgi:hypothetical protein
LPGTGLPEAVRKHGELSVASDKRGEASFGLYVESAPCLPSGEHVPSSDGLGLALKRAFTEGLRIEEAFDQVMHGFGDDDLSRFGCLQEARGNVRRVADRGVVHAQVASNTAHDDQPRVESLSHPEVNAPVAFEIVPIRLENLPNAERRLNCPARIIFVSDGRSE